MTQRLPLKNGDTALGRKELRRVALGHGNAIEVCEQAVSLSAPSPLVGR